MNGEVFCFVVFFSFLELCFELVELFGEEMIVIVFEVIVGFD